MYAKSSGAANAMVLSKEGLMLPNHFRVPSGTIGNLELGSAVTSAIMHDRRFVYADYASSILFTPNRISAFAVPKAERIETFQVSDWCSPGDGLDRQRLETYVEIEVLREALEQKVLAAGLPEDEVAA